METYNYVLYNFFAQNYNFIYSGLLIAIKIKATAIYIFVPAHVNIRIME